MMTPKPSSDDEVSSEDYSTKFLATLGTIIKGSVQGSWRCTYDNAAKLFHRVSVLFKGGFKEKNEPERKKIREAIAGQLFALRLQSAVHPRLCRMGLRVVTACSLFLVRSFCDEGPCNRDLCQHLDQASAQLAVAVEGQEPSEGLQLLHTAASQIRSASPRASASLDALGRLADVELLGKDGKPCSSPVIPASHDDATADDAAGRLRPQCGLLARHGPCAAAERMDPASCAGVAPGALGPAGSLWGDLHRQSSDVRSLREALHSLAETSRWEIVAIQRRLAEYDAYFFPQGGTMAATGNFPVGFSEAGFWAWGPKQWAGSAQGSIDLGPFFLPENPEGNLAAATYSVWILQQGGTWENPLCNALRTVIDIGRFYLQAPGDGVFEEQQLGLAVGSRGSVSGEGLLDLDLASFLQTLPEGMHPVRSLKQHLHKICGLSRFRQRLVYLDDSGDGNVVLDDDRTLKTGEVQVVLLSFCQASEAQVTALLDAARLGLTRGAENILQRPQDPDLAVLGHPTPLFFAARHGHVGVTRVLLEANADKDKATQAGATPLLIAAEQGHLQIARLLLEAHADKDKAMPGGATPLFIAAQNGQLEVVRLLLEANADKDKAMDDGVSPLFIAAQNGQLEVARLLLEAHADKDKAMQGGATPLFIAAHLGQMEVARLLLESNADKDKAKDDGATPLYIAAEKGQLEVARLLLEANADIHKTTHAGFTPLHIAAKTGQLEVVRLLLEASADKDKAADDGTMPLFIAAENG
eukprot:s591_g2.t1